ncbi:MAG: DUF4350 domain-containing protein, partial [Armatimonadetes bacterium]|nr:DUF4350 domain-containing protein [Armatimonadota bacterium]
MSVFREFRLLLFLMVAFILLWVVLGNETQEEETNPLLSSYNHTYPGLKAWFLLLEELGIPVRRLTQRFPEEPDHRGLLVIAAPVVPLDSEEADRTLSWVKGGGNLFYIGGLMGNPALERRLGIERKRVKAEDGAVSPVRRNAFTEYVGNLFVGTGFLGRVFPGQFRFKKLPPGAVPAYADKNGPLLAHWRLGEGRVIALADPAPLSNQYIDREGNARLAVWVAKK